MEVKRRVAEDAEMEPREEQGERMRG